MTVVSEENMKQTKQGSSESSTSSKNDNDFEYKDLYPERRGDKFQRSWFRTFFLLEGKEEIKKIKCERNVYWCYRNSPLVKLLVGALNSAGCPFDIGRHVSCEVCNGKVSGGYDPEMNQVVVCHNVATRRSLVQGVLTHELIHMFDYCENELDFKNIRHLACSEIRAANLAHCSFMSAWLYGDASPWNIKQRHAECVKNKALSSVMAVKNVTKEEAMKAINEVFPKCYNDLEPIGRRCRRNSPDFEHALLEAPLYGYDYKL